MFSTSRWTGGSGYQHSVRPSRTPGTTSSAGESRSGPSIFTAIKEQLGYRLDARKGQVEVVVIDRVKNIPTDN